MNDTDERLREMERTQAACAEKQDGRWERTKSIEKLVENNRAHCDEQITETRKIFREDISLLRREIIEAMKKANDDALKAWEKMETRNEKRWDDTVETLGDLKLQITGHAMKVAAMWSLGTGIVMWGILEFLVRVVKVV